MIYAAIAGVLYLALNPFIVHYATRRPTVTDNLDAKLNQLLATRIHCVVCAAAAKTQTDDAEVRVNLANVIAGGNGLCWDHIQFHNGPVLPGQTPSGLYLPGVGA